MKLFQNQKLESELNGFRNNLIVSSHPPFLNKEGVEWNFQKMDKGVTNFGGVIFLFLAIIVTVTAFAF